MTPDEKLAAILAAVQTDPGNRGLARDPHDNLFTATRGDFQDACRSICKEVSIRINVLTGFYIPSSNPPAFETDGPLGAFFLYRAFHLKHGRVGIGAEEPIKINALDAAQEKFCYYPHHFDRWTATHEIWLERTGSAKDGKHYTMRGIDTTYALSRLMLDHEREMGDFGVTIGIGDGGNEIGMGKIPHETIVKNIPNGALIHCRVPTDHLIVAGVSNWGAYALAAGIFVLKGVTPPDDLFDPDREREILDVMVKAGPLVDGVTGEQTATVDGLSWEEYVKPLVRIRDILAS